MRVVRDVHISALIIWYIYCGDTLLYQAKSR